MRFPWQPVPKNVISVKCALFLTEKWYFVGLSCYSYVLVVGLTDWLSANFIKGQGHRKRSRSRPFFVIFCIFLKENMDLTYRHMHIANNERTVCPLKVSTSILVSFNSLYT